MHEKIAQYCIQNLNLDDAELSEEYFYASLPFCIIDAVYSLGVRYSSTRNTVIHFCDIKGLQRLRLKESPFLDISQQYSVHQFDDLLSHYDDYKQIAVELFNNKQRTSSRNGILKAEAVHKFARVLLKYNVNYFQDISKVIYDLNFENDICLIPGQTYGTALTYFFMLAGDDNKVKPDRMIYSFLVTTQVFFFQQEKNFAINLRGYILHISS